MSQDPKPEFNFAEISDGLDLAIDMFTAVGSRAFKLKDVYESQGWSPAIAEQMAFMAYLRLAGFSGGSPQG